MVSLIAALLMSAVLPAMAESRPESRQTADVSELDISWVRAGHIVSEYGIGLVSISPNGSTMASGGGGDGTVKIWNLQDRKLLKTVVLYPRQRIASVDFATDGSKLLVCGSAYTAILDAQEWKMLKQYPAPSPYGAIFVDRNRGFMLGNPARIYDAERGSLAVRLSDVVQNKFRFSYLYPHVEPYIATSLFDKDRRIFAAGIPGRRYVDLDVAHQEYLSYMDCITVEPQESYAWWSAGKFSHGRYGPGWWPDLSDMAYLPSGEMLLYGRTTKGPNDFLDLQTIDHTFRTVAEYPLIPISKPTKDVCFGVCFSPQRDRFAITMVDKRQQMVDPYTCLRLIDCDGIRPIGQEVFIPGRLKGLAVDGEALIANTGDLVRYSPNSSRPVRFTQINSPIAGLSFINQSTPAAASLYNGSITLWNPGNPDNNWSIVAPTIVQRGLDNKLMSPALLTDIAVWDGKLIGGAVGPYMFVLDAKTGKELNRYVLDPDTGNVDRPIIRYLNGGAQAVAGTPLSKKGIRMLDTDTGKELKSFLPSSEILKLEVSSKYIVAVTDSKLRVWDVLSAKLLYEGDLPAGKIAFMAINERLNVLALADNNGKLASFDLKTGKKKNEFAGNSGPILALCLTRDNQMITLSDDAVDPAPLKVWDLATGKLQKQFAKEMAPFSSQYPLSNNLAYDDKSGILAISRSDGTILGVKID